MAEQIDVRGLSCPQPVFETRKKIQALGKGVIEIVCDSGTARDNITRLADHEGWTVSINENNDEFIITLQKV